MNKFIIFSICILFFGVSAFHVNLLLVAHPYIPAKSAGKLQICYLAKFQTGERLFT